MAAMRNTMPKIEIDKDWCLRRALLEGDSEVGAGPLAGTPGIDRCPTCLSFHRDRRGECHDLWHDQRANT
jgi:hypothetical protein